MGKRLSNFIALFLGLLFISYSVYRAAALSITYDEAYSYLFFVNNSYQNIISNGTISFMSANNHVLNTVLVKFLLQYLPLTELTLRIPSLLAHAIFLYFSWMILKKAYNPLLRISLFIFINLNPFLLDFFSISRGYALSLAMMLASLYYLINYFGSPAEKQPGKLLSVVFGSLAILANFSIINYYIGLMAVLLFWEMIRLRKNGKDIKLLINRNNLIAFIISISTLIYGVYMGLRLRTASALYFGGNNNFWKDTVESLVKQCLYGQTSLFKFIPYIMFCAAGIMAICAVLILLSTISKRQVYILPPDLVIVFSLLTLAILSTIIQHKLFGTLYLIERTALLFMVLFLILSSLLSIHLYKLSAKFIILPVSSALLFALQLGFCANFSYFYTWKMNADDKRMMMDIDKERISQSINTEFCLFKPSWDHQPTCEFYKLKFNYYWLKLTDRINITFKEDFVFQPLVNKDAFLKKNYGLIRTYPAADFALFQKKTHNAHEILLEKKVTLDHEANKIYGKPYTGQNHFEEVASGQGGKLLRINTKEWLKKDSVVFNDIDFELLTDANHNDIHLLMAMHSSNNEVYDWNDKSLRLEYIKKDKWSKMNVTVQMPDIKDEGSYMDIWIQNNNNSPIYLSPLSIKVIK